MKKLPAYYRALDVGRFPIERGYTLTSDDLVRRHVITELMCNFYARSGRVGAPPFGIDFDDYFGAELDGLLRRVGPVADGAPGDPRSMRFDHRAGRLFVRTICMEFDRYLPSHRGKPVFSRTV